MQIKFKGTSTNVEISRVRRSRKESPYSECRKDLNVSSSDSLYFKLTSNLNKYSQKLCAEVYKQKNKVIKSCACNHPSLPIVNTNQICQNLTSLTCGLEAMQSKDDSFPTSGECPMECESKEFILKTNSALYPTMFYSKILGNLNSIKNKFSPPFAFEPNNNPFPGPEGPDGGKQQPIALQKDLLKGNNIASTGIHSSSVPSRNTSTSSIYSSNMPSTATINSTNFSRDSSNTPEIRLDQLMRSCLKTNVFYTDLTYTHIDEDAAITFDILIGTIGFVFKLSQTVIKV